MQSGRINLDWDNFSVIFERIRTEMPSSFFGLSRYVWGRVIALDGDYLKVNLGGKSLVNYPLWFLQDFQKDVELGMRVPCYVSNPCNVNGKVNINQERLVYLIYKWYAGFCAQTKKNLVANIESTLWKGLVLSIFPHQCAGETKSFKIFMPINQNSANLYKINNQITVQLQKVDYKGRNIVASLNDKSLGENLKEEFDNIKLHQLVNGTVTQIIPQGAMVQVNNFICFLPLRNMSYNTNKLNVRDFLKVGDQIANLYVLSKNVEEKKVYLSARHLFDHLNNYFKQDELVDAQVKFIRGKRVYIQAKNLSLPIHLKYLSLIYYEYSNIQVGQIVTLIYNEQDGNFDIPREVREKFWETKSLPKLHEAILAKVIHVDKRSIKFLGDGKNYIMKYSCVDRMNRSLLTFMNISENSKLKVVPYKFSFSDSCLYVRPLDILIRQELLTMPRRISAVLRQVTGNVLLLDLTPRISTKLVLTNISSQLDMRKGARINVIITKISLVHKTVQVSLA